MAGGGAGEAVPPSVRLLAGFYFLGAVIGCVTGIFETIDFFQGESHNLAVSWGGGVSTWALGRGVLRGSGWAYTWSKRVAWSGVFAMAAFGLLIALAPDTLQVNAPGFSGEMSRTDPRLVGTVALLFLLFLAQAVVLRSESVRAFFAPEPESAED